MRIESSDDVDGGVWDSILNAWRYKSDIIIQNNANKEGIVNTDILACSNSEKRQSNRCLLFYPPYIFIYDSRDHVVKFSAHT